jgi:hypothetical protein
MVSRSNLLWFNEGDCILQCGKALYFCLLQNLIQQRVRCRRQTSLLFAAACRNGSYALEQSPRLIPLLASFLLLQSPQQMTTWERLNPKSFISTVYLRCQVVHHTWLLYFVPQQGRESDTRIPWVGRVLEVVDSIDKVPGGEKFPAVQEPFQEVYLAAVP